MSTTTKLSQLIVPEVLEDMLNAKLSDRITFLPFAKIDETLVGIPGNTVTVPRYAFGVTATDLAEDTDGTYSELSTADVQYSVKKIFAGVTLSDEAILSGFGNPVGQAQAQISKALQVKMDGDILDSLMDATLFYDGSSAKISYNSIINSIDVFAEEFNTEKVLFIHPSQVTTLRQDSNFVSAEAYALGNQLIMTGEIGKIANTRLVSSKKVPVFSVWYSPAQSGDSGALQIIASGTPTASQVLLSDVKASLPNEVVGNYVVKSTTKVYFNPLVKINWDQETELDIPALTIYMKRGANVDTFRDIDNKTNKINADVHYVSALTDATKVVLAKIKA